MGTFLPPGWPGQADGSMGFIITCLPGIYNLAAVMDVLNFSYDMPQ